MAIKVVFHRLAAKEARTAEAWYAERSTEAADHFRTAVLLAAQRIVDDVETHSLGKSRFRYVVVRRFAYRLVYCLESEFSARIIAVSHFRRRPGHWRRRK